MTESRLANIFAEVHQLPADQQENRFRELTAGDHELASQVLALLHAYRQNPDFLEQPATLPLNFTINRHIHQPGINPGHFLFNTEIGPYKILKSIGHGGMGQVYLVQQDQPIQRTLAMKVLSFKVSEASIARFEIERQTLALVNHPYIARVVDGGTIDGIFPYFVMEYVDGKPLDEFLRDSRPDLQARIQLFLKICDAIRHAHQKGVIHRDIKPSNILVEHLDDNLVPKVIDFGLAKWLGENTGLAPYDSGELRVIGTLPFVSPEQLFYNSQPADVRSDVYSLGTILYLLLTGSTPFARKSGLLESSDLELIRRIREEEPVRPSQFLKNQTCADSRSYRLDLHNLPRTLANDLDWITLKSLEKNAGNRYQSVDELSADIRAALVHMPVQAGPPALLPRAQKYLKRHKIRVALMAMAALMFVTLAVSYFQTRRAWLLASDRLAQTNLANLRLMAASHEIKSANAQLASALAESEKSRSEAENITDFLVNAFAKPRPGQGGANLRVIDVIRNSARQLMSSFNGNQAARGKLLLTLGNTLRAMGEYDESLPPLKLALKIEAEELGETAPETISCVCQIGRSLSALKRYDEAVTLYEKWRKILEFADQTRTSQYAAVMNNLARAYMSMNQTDKALNILQHSESIFHENTESKPFQRAMIQQAISEIYARRGDTGKAIAMQTKSLREIENDLGPGYPQTISSRQFLIQLLADSDPVEAEALLRENEAWIRKKFPPTLPIFKDRMRVVAATYGKIGKPDDQKRILAEMEHSKSKSNHESASN